LGVALAGAGAVAQSLFVLYNHPIGWTWTILALLTLASGSATVNLPGMPATVSVSETFVFTSVLLFGVEAGTLTVALDALVISFWSFRRGHAHYKILFNVCAIPLTLWAASHLYYALSPYQPLYQNAKVVQIHRILLPLLAFTITYYCINTWIITVAIALEKQLSPIKIWRENFVWLALNYFGGASVAALLVSYTHDLDYTFLLIIVPLLVVLYFTFSTSMGRVEDSNRHLSELNRLYMSTIETLAMAIDAKDQITHGHIRRVQVYAVGLARAMGVSDASQVRAIEAAALLHDMGKLAVPEYILNKPGPLTAAEFEKMKLHASVGADILSAIEFPYPVVPIVRHHHENWDGTGYPDGIKGADIPIGARILSVVDCFDALTSDRPYRPRLSDKEALNILQDRRGTMYDPLVVDVFCKVHASIAPTETLENQQRVLQAITTASADCRDGISQSQTRLEDIAASSDEMVTLFDLARALGTRDNLRDAAELISSHVRRLIPCNVTVLYLYDDASDELVAVHAAGVHSEFVNRLRIPIGQRLSGWVAANRQPIRNSDPMLDFGDSARAMSPRLRSSLSTPMLNLKRLAGVMSVYSTTKDAFTEEHLRVLEVVAAQVASVIAEIGARERGRLSRVTDSLFGLPGSDDLMRFLGSHRATRDPEDSISAIVVMTSARARNVEGAVLALVDATRRAVRYGDALYGLSESAFAAILLHTDHDTADSLRRRVQQAVDELARRFGIEARVALCYSLSEMTSVRDLLVHATTGGDGAGAVH
jgi:putative nucleotidyltransferase with HDIG domain